MTTKKNPSHNYKVMVLNYSGNVGKSVISRHLLEPRLHNAVVVPVETINSNEHEADAIKGKQFSALLEDMAIEDSAVIVDVGASNIEILIGEMEKIVGSHEDFDYFIIPTVPTKKQQIDTIKTIQALYQIGVPSDKILLVFNMVDDKSEVPEIFSSLFAYHAQYGSFDLKQDAIIGTNDVYLRLRDSGKTINDVLIDETVSRDAIRQEKDLDKKQSLSANLITKRLADGVSKELDGVFNALFC
jgi:hypothetical protein